MNHCPVCGESYADDINECYQRPDNASGQNGWCAVQRVKWSE